MATKLSELLGQDQARSTKRTVPEFRVAPPKETTFTAFRPTELDVAKRMSGLSEEEIRRTFRAPKKSFEKTVNVASKVINPGAWWLQGVMALKDYGIRKFAAKEPFKMTDIMDTLTRSPLEQRNLQELPGFNQAVKESKKKLEKHGNLPQKLIAKLTPDEIAPMLAEMGLDVAVLTAGSAAVKRFFSDPAKAKLLVETFKEIGRKAQGVGGKTKIPLSEEAIREAARRTSMAESVKRLVRAKQAPPVSSRLSTPPPRPPGATPPTPPGAIPPVPGAMPSVPGAMPPVRSPVPTRLPQVQAPVDMIPPELVGPTPIGEKPLVEVPKERRAPVEEFKEELEAFRMQLEEAEGGKRVIGADEVTDELIFGGRGVQSDFIGRVGAPKKDIIRVIDKVLKAEKLTGKQEAIMDALVEEARLQRPALEESGLVAPPEERIFRPVVPQAKAPKIEPGVLPTGKTKSVINRNTRVRKAVDTIASNEQRLLREKLRVEARGAKVGEAAGKREIRQMEANKRTVTGLVKSINSLAGRKLPLEYRNQVDAIVDSFDLNYRTPRTMASRERLRDFVDRLRGEGEMIPIPEAQLAKLDALTLNDMTMDDLQELRDTLGQIVHIGSLKGKLIASKQARDFAEVEKRIVDQIADTGKVELAPLETPLVTKRKGRIKRAVQSVDNMSSSLRKVEYVSRVLDGWKEGPVQTNIIQPIQDAGDAELLQTQKSGEQLSEAFGKLKNLGEIVSKEIDIPGIAVTLTRENMLMVALNAENPGNIERLVRGNQFTPEQIQKIKNALTDEEKAFVSDIFKAIESHYPASVETTAKLTGEKMGKVDGKYFPIIEDRELSAAAKYREAEQDLFQDVFNRTYVERGHTKNRKGGSGAINLTFQSIFRHTNDVIHFNTHALPVRDVQKIITSPKVSGAIGEVMTEGVYRQYPKWLKDVANPRTPMLNGFENIMERMRNNMTVFTLGWRFTTSLLQGGSFTQTINEIGLGPAMGGLQQMTFHPHKSINFMLDKSVQMKFRANTFDRELMSFMDSKQAKALMEGKAMATDVFFAMIKGIDFYTTGASWMGAYNKAIKLNPEDAESAVRYADRIVRLTQPQGGVKDLAQISRGRPFQKLWTSFYSHFSNVHNQMVDTVDKLKFGKGHPIRKVRDFAFSWWWILVAPALYSTMVRTGGEAARDKEKFKDTFKRELINYGSGGIPIVRDVVRTVTSPFKGISKLSAPAGFRGLDSAARAFGSKTVPTKIKHGLKSASALTGLVPEQVFNTGEGIYDLATGKTQDWRRLYLSEYALRDGAGGGGGQAGGGATKLSDLL